MTCVGEARTGSDFIVAFGADGRYRCSTGSKFADCFTPLAPSGSYSSRKLNNQPFWVCVILKDGAGAVDVQLPSTREVNTYATDGVIPPGCSKQTATDEGRKSISHLERSKFGRAAPS